MVNFGNGMNDLTSYRDHVKLLIARTDERLEKLMRDLKGTEPRTQVIR
jgi:hypothetical protein